MPGVMVFVRSHQTGGDYQIGTHTFLQALTKGGGVTFQGETWIVVELRLEEDPPVVVLQFPER